MEIRQNVELLPKSEFESDLEYWFRKHFGGRSSGRRLKRVVAKFGCMQLVCGAGLVIITGCESQLFPGEEHFATLKYGASLMSLMYIISIPTFLLGLSSLLLLRFWTTLTTNRQLLVMVARGYALICAPLFVFLLWTLIVMFLAFQGVEWKNDPLLTIILPYYVISVFLVLVILLTFLYYMMDLSYLADEAQRRESVIGEPLNAIYNDSAHHDLSGLNPADAMHRLCSKPAAFFHHCGSLIHSIVSHSASQLDPSHTTLQGLFPLRTSAVQQDPSAPSHARKESAVHRLHALTRDPDHWRMEGEDEEAAVEAEKYPPQANPHTSKVEAALPREESSRSRQRANKGEDDFFDSGARVLSVSLYKQLWSTLEPAGSFQCRLREPVSAAAFTNHLRSQGFHIVFSSSPSASESEVGISNIRIAGIEPWFLARFLFTRSTLSAVMKTEDKASLRESVSKFALNKILKMDKPGS